MSEKITKRDFENSSRPWNRTLGPEINKRAMAENCNKMLGLIGCLLVEIRDELKTPDEKIKIKSVVYSSVVEATKQAIREVTDEILEENPGDICLTCGYQRGLHSLASDSGVKKICIDACDDFVKSILQRPKPPKPKNTRDGFVPPKISIDSSIDICKCGRQRGNIAHGVDHEFDKQDGVVDLKINHPGDICENCGYSRALHYGHLKGKNSELDKVCSNFEKRLL